MLQNDDLLDMWYSNVFSKPQATLGEPDFDVLTQHGYNASTDLPVSLYYEELVTKYPDAKFILTTKSSAKAWFRSWESLLTQAFLVPRLVPWYPQVHKFDQYNRWLLALFHKNNSFLTMAHTLHQDATTVMQAYEDHNARVRQVIPPKQLLEFNLTDGWDPLCAFLDKPVPSTGFPRVNSTARVVFDVWKLILISNGGLFGIVVLVVWIVRCIVLQRIRHRVGGNATQKKRQ